MPAVSLHADVAPALAPGHSLVFSIDGSPVPASGLAAAVEVYRGEHTVVAEILDQNGEILESSAPVSFSVRQPSVANPPRGPLQNQPLRPKL
jgi:hypothetical protein